MVLALIFEGFNALSALAYKALDLQFDIGKMRLGDYGKQKAKIEANAGYPKVLAQIHQSNPDLALGEQADRALQRWQAQQQDESVYIAWFLDSPHGGQGAKGRAGLSSADLYAYEKVMALSKIQMSRTMNLLVNGPPGPRRITPVKWQTFMSEAQKLWETMPADTRKPACFLHIGHTAQHRYPAEHVDLIAFGFSARMMTQAYVENAGYPFPVIQF